MMKFASKMLLLGGLTALAGAGSAVASQADSDAPAALVVRYNADMLSTDSGARALYSRIERAAEKVCPNDSYSLLVGQKVRECRGQAVAAAVSKIHNQRLAAVHAAASSKAG